MILSGRPDLSRSVSPFLTDYALPSRRIPRDQVELFLNILQEVLSGPPDRSYVVVSVFHSCEDKHGRHPILNNLLKRSFP